MSLAALILEGFQWWIWVVSGQNKVISENLEFRLIHGFLTFHLNVTFST